MKTFGAVEVIGALDFESLTERLKEAFCSPIEAPVRSQFNYRAGASAESTLLLMPAWREEGFLGVKVVTVNPANPEKGRPLVSGCYLLLDASTGELLALMDAPALTARRTAAASALASSFLSRHDSQTLLMVGAGALAPHLIRAHGTVRTFKLVRIWSRNSERAARLAAEVSTSACPAEAVENLEPAARSSDLISCATPAREPLILGEWLRPGTHVDLVGSFAPGMREIDLAAVVRSRVFVDTRSGALSEAGELLDALSSGEFRESDIQGDLFDLCTGQTAGRVSAEEITLFKSVGTALEDLAAAQLVYERAGAV